MTINNIREGWDSMAFLDHTSEVKVHYSKESVMEAISEAIKQIDKMEIDSIDKITGRVIVKAGISLFSWGESITIIVEEFPQNETCIAIMSTPKTGALFGGMQDMGKNRKNIDAIFSKVSKCLETKRKIDKRSEQHLSIDDSTERMKKLSRLLASNLINKDEYDKKRMDILDSI